MECDYRALLAGIDSWIEDEMLKAHAAVRVWTGSFEDYQARGREQAFSKVLAHVRGVSRKVSK